MNRRSFLLGTTAVLCAAATPLLQAMPAPLPVKPDSMLRQQIRAAIKEHGGYVPRDPNTLKAINRLHYENWLAVGSPKPGSPGFKVPKFKWQAVDRKVNKQLNPEYFRDWDDHQLKALSG